MLFRSSSSVPRSVRFLVHEIRKTVFLTYPEANGSLFPRGQLSGECVASGIRDLPPVRGGHGDVEWHDLIVDWGRSAPVSVLRDNLQRPSLTRTFEPKQTFRILGKIAYVASSEGFSGWLDVQPATVGMLDVGGEHRLGWEVCQTSRRKFMGGLECRHDKIRLYTL